MLFFNKLVHNTSSDPGSFFFYQVLAKKGFMDFYPEVLMIMIESIYL